MLLDSAREVLVTGGIDALRSILTLNRLASSVPASRTAVYKSFTSVDELILDLGTYVIEDISWGGYADATGAIASAYFSESDASPEDRLKKALLTNFDQQMTSPAMPALWFLLSAIASCSPQWKGAKPQDAETIALGKELLEQRKGWYDKISSDFLFILETGMSDLGLRPRAGVDAKSIVVLLQCLHDGATLRRLFDPESVPSELVADAMLTLGMALGEQGVRNDPRHPTESVAASDAFDLLLETAEREWNKREKPTVKSVAISADIPLSTAEMLFRSDGDLYDSLARKRIVGGGFHLPDRPDVVQAQQHFYAFRAQLMRVVAVVKELPGLMEACASLGPESSNPILQDLVTNAATGIAPLTTIQDAVQFATDAFALATGGRKNLLAIEALLRTSGLQPPSE